jgi:molybdopterin-guanine dinucleotide biosynthesis protein B
MSPHRVPLPNAGTLMQALGIVGWSGSGKTTLLTALIPAFRAKGLRVSSIKHAHHRLTLDQPGKDSFRHAEAGAEEVILAGPEGFALFNHAGPPDLHALLARLAPVDLVLVEGFKDYRIPKLEVHRPSQGHRPLWPEMEVMAVASDDALPYCPLPVLNLSDIAGMADTIMAALGLDRGAGF